MRVGATTSKSNAIMVFLGYEDMGLWGNHATLGLGQALAVASSIR